MDDTLKGGFGGKMTRPLQCAAMSNSEARRMEVAQ